MGEFIDRQKLEAHFSPAITGKEAYTAGEVLLSIQKFPSADVAPVIHAHWVHRTAEWNFTEECSKCHFGHDYRTPFCPICGAKMDEEVG